MLLSTLEEWTLNIERRNRKCEDSETRQIEANQLRKGNTIEERSDIIIRCSMLGVRCSTFSLLLGSLSLRRVYEFQHLTDDSINIVISDLAGADLLVTAAAVFQNQGADVHR